MPDLPEPPDQLGPYRVLRRLGQGGMGTVYDALDTTLDRHVALKLIAPGLAGDPELRARFVREARAQASLDSPHVVQVFAHGELGGQLYIATQLVPDGDLGRHLRRHGPLPPERAAAIVAQVAEGLAEAHRLGLTHRDVKPSNVLLRHRGTDTVAYLADFGIAAPLADEGVGADVRALGRLLEAATGGTDPVLARVVREATSAAAVRDGLRDALRGRCRRGRGTCRRASARAGVVLAAAAVLATVLVAVLVAVLAGRPESEPTAGPDDPALTSLARLLRDRAGLDAAGAACTARALVEEYGAEVAAVAAAGGQAAEAVVEDAVAAASRCLW